MAATIGQFLREWKRESEATLRIMSCLTDASLAQQAGPGGRTLGYLAWHVVLTLGEMGGKAGLPVQAPPEDSGEPRQAAVIAAAYKAASDSVAAAVQSTWRDDMLDGEISLYGRPWRRADVLDSLVHHQIHHRGQMTVLMRQAGLVVPGIYGPAREEWAKMGMPALR